MHILAKKSKKLRVMGVNRLNWSPRPFLFLFWPKSTPFRQFHFLSSFQSQDTLTVAIVFSSPLVSSPSSLFQFNLFFCSIMFFCCDFMNFDTAMWKFELPSLSTKFIFFYFSVEFQGQLCVLSLFSCTFFTWSAFWVDVLVSLISENFCVNCIYSSLKLLLMMRSCCIAASTVKFAGVSVKLFTPPHLIGGFPCESWWSASSDIFICNTFGNQFMEEKVGFLFLRLCLLHCFRILEACLEWE